MLAMLRYSHLKRQRMLFKVPKDDNAMSNNSLFLLLSKWFVLVMTVLCAAFAVAHDGIEHDEPSPSTPTQIAPRFALTGDDVELVGVWADNQLVLYADDKYSNAPIDHAQIDIQSPHLNGTATALGNGVYRLRAQTLKAGTYSLTISLSSDTLSELWVTSLNITPKNAAPAMTHNDRDFTVLYGFLALLLALVVAVVWYRRGANHRV